MIYSYTISINSNLIAHLITYLQVNKLITSLTIKEFTEPITDVTIYSALQYEPFVNKLSDLDYGMFINKFESNWCTSLKEALRDYKDKQGEIEIDYATRIENEDKELYDGYADQ